MKRFEIFRTKDPQVSTWLQKNGFQNRRSNSYEHGGDKESMEKIEKDIQTKEVRFHLDESLHGKIPKNKGRTLASRSAGKMKADSNRERLKNTHEIPATILSQDFKRIVYDEKTELTKNSFNYTQGNRIRSFSNPLNDGLDDHHVPVVATNIAGRSKLARTYSSLSLSSERPSNIPVLIRNNNTRLRKYSCPENRTRRPEQADQREVKASERNGLGRKPMVVSNNATPELGNVFLNQTTKNIDPRKVARGKFIVDVKTLRGAKKYSERRKDDPLRTEIKSSNLQTDTDLNGNYIPVNPSGPIIAGSLSDSSGDEELGLKLYEDDSLQSYSLEMQPKALKHHFPSSMYSTRGNMLSWLGEVNRNNPQLWS